ncbi:MAG TPA: hypothetical protein VMV17_09245 [Streptosporangiaceae bacterium]|nr:hypothetical protein [Streptosporangiaceae bacterium]
MSGFIDLWPQIIGCSAAGILAIHALPGTIRVALAIVVVLGLWWGPFG